MKKAYGPNIPPEEAEDFLTGRPDTWRLIITLPDGKRRPCPEAIGWQIASPLGDIDHTVITAPDGTPLYDTPRLHYKDTVIVVVWGKNQAGEPCVILLHHERPCAEHPQQNLLKLPATSHLTFAQAIMGFIEEGETPEDAALREAQEEARVLAEHVQWTSRPETPYLNPDPQLHASWNHLYFVQIDLEPWTTSLSYPRSSSDDPGEVSYTLEVLTLPLLHTRISQGVVNGVYYRDALTLGALLTFMACQPWVTPSP